MLPLLELHDLLTRTYSLHDAEMPLFLQINTSIITTFTFYIKLINISVMLCLLKVEQVTKHFELFCIPFGNDEGK